jgi:hypothetical protein
MVEDIYLLYKKLKKDFKIFL